MKDDVYIKQREYLHNMPGGFPESPTGVEIKILKKLYTPEEAGLFIHLKEEPETVGTIAQRIGKSETELAEKLEEMAKKGLIFRIKRNGKPLYQAYQFYVGIIEFQINRVDEELMALMAEYSPYMNSTGLGLKNKHMRVIPIASSIEKMQSIQSYHQMREIVKDEDVIAVAPCLCRQMAQLAGGGCNRPIETCLSFGDHAQFYIDNGVARQLTKSELMELLRIAEEERLVISSMNTKNLSIVCLCCSCCCGLLNGLKALPQSELMVNIQFYVKIDPSLCTACEACMDQCQIDAITSDDKGIAVNPEKCIGCGLCMPVCPVEAISFIPNPRAKVPADDLDSYMTSVREERGIESVGHKTTR